MPHDADAPAAGPARLSTNRFVNVPAALAAPLARHVLVLAAFTAVTLLWLAPLVTDLGGSLLGEPGDGSGSLRDYWAAQAQDSSVFTWERDELATAPEGMPRSSAVAVANAVTPIFVLALEPIVGLVAAWNVFVVLGFVLTGFVTFMLLRRLFGSGAAAFGAYVFTFNAFMVEKAVVGHASFVHAWVFPLLLLVLLRVHERRDLPSAVLAGLVVAVAFYLQSYYGLLALVLVGVFMAVDLALAKGERLWSFTLLDVVLGTALVALAPVGVLWLLERDQVAAVIANPVADLQQLGASLSAYLAPSGRHPLLGDLGEESQQTTSGEPTLFFGYTTLLLAAAGAVLLARRRRISAFDGRAAFAATVAAVLVPVAFVFSLPRELHVLGVDVPMPSYFLGEIVTYWRVYARFGVLVGLGLVVLASLAVHAVFRRRGGAALGAALLALVAFELSPGFDVPTWDASTPPAHVRWLAAHPGGTVAYYPEPEEPNAFLYLMNREYAFQRVHGHPLYNMWGGGWSGTRVEAIRILSRNPADPLTPGILAAERVRYVVALEDVDRGGASVPGFPPESYRQVGRVPNARIYEVAAPPVDLGEVLEAQRARVGLAQSLGAPSQTFGDGFYGAEEWTDGRSWRWLRQDGRIAVDNTSRAKEFTFRFSAFSARRARTLELRDSSGRTLGRADVPTHAVDLVFTPVPLPKGVTELTLRAEPGPEPLDARAERITSVYVSPISIEPLATYAER